MQIYEWGITIKYVSDMDQWQIQDLPMTCFKVIAVYLVGFGNTSQTQHAPVVIGPDDESLFHPAPNKKCNVTILPPLNNVITLTSHNIALNRFLTLQEITFCVGICSSNLSLSSDWVLCSPQTSGVLKSRSTVLVI